MHVAYIGLVNTSEKFKITEPRILQDAQNQNTNGFPTIKRYIELEEESGHRIHYIDQNVIITYPNAMNVLNSLEFTAIYDFSEISSLEVDGSSIERAGNLATNGNSNDIDMIQSVNRPILQSPDAQQNRWALFNLNGGTAMGRSLVSESGTSADFIAVNSGYMSAMVRNIVSPTNGTQGFITLTRPTLVTMARFGSANTAAQTGGQLGFQHLARGPGDVLSNQFLVPVEDPAFVEWRKTDTQFGRRVNFGEWEMFNVGDINGLTGPAYLGFPAISGNPSFEMALALFRNSPLNDTEQDQLDALIQSRFF